MSDTYPPEMIEKLVAVYRLAEELCIAVDCAEADVGGCRPISLILSELGPVTDAVKL